MTRIVSFLLVLVLFSCNNDHKETKTSISPDWQMIEMYGDEIEELNVGGYYGLFYDRDNPMKDSFLEETDDRIVAIVVPDTLEVGKSQAIIWAADDKRLLTLEKDSTVGKQFYKRVYANEDFRIELNMKFWERIDGMDEDDMYIYRGKMKITALESGDSKEYKVKGGI